MIKRINRTNIISKPYLIDHHKNNEIYVEKNIIHDEIDKEQLKKLLDIALLKGGDYSDVYYEYTERNSFFLEEGIIKNCSERIGMGIGIRTVKGIQTGYAYSEDFEFNKLKKAAETASNISRSSSTAKLNKLKEKSFRNRYPVIKSMSEVSIEKKIKIIKDCENAAYSLDNKIKKVNINFIDEKKIVIFANSEGVLLKDIRPLLLIHVSAIAEDKKIRQIGIGRGGGRVGFEYFDARSAGDIGRDAARHALVMLESTDSPAGVMEVVLAAADSGVILHEAVGHPLEGDFNRIGSSAYSGRLNQKVASSLCTIIDSGKITNNTGALNFDDEGIISQENILIENGILKGYMHDRISAKHFNVKPTGNGRRESYKYHPIPRMTTTYMPAGKSEPEEIISSTKNGIFCKTFSGGQVDISNGDFVFVPSEAYLIEKGKITRPIKNLTLIGNGPDVLNKVTMVGNDFRFSDGVWQCGKGQLVPVGIGLPTIKISTLTVGGSKV